MLTQARTTESTILDFKGLKLGFRPNQYFVCPAGWNDEEAHNTAPVFPVPIDVLQEAWDAVINRQPRVEIREADPKSRYYELVQRTAFFRFPDTISAVLVSLGDQGSTLAIYSRSTYGYSDLGVNKARVEDWIAQAETVMEQA